MNIIVVKTKFIGDTILASAFFEALKSIFPNAKVTAVLSPLTEQVLRHNPYIDHRIITSCLDSHNKYSNKNSNKQRLIDSYYLLKTLRNGNYTIAFVLTRSFYSALLIRLSKISNRIGLDTEGRGFLLTQAMNECSDTHEYINYLRLLKIPVSLTGINVSGIPLDQLTLDQLSRFKPKYFAISKEIEYAKTYLRKYATQQTKPLIFFHLSGTNALRRWRIEHWAWLANECARKGYGLIWSGVTADATQMRAIQAQLSPQAKSASCVLSMLSGGDLLPIRELAALISLCAATVSVDTGPMHLSAALGIPTIGLFGPGDTVRWQPVGYSSRGSVGALPTHVAVISSDILPCRPCHGRAGCPRIQADSQLPICMHNLAPQLVFAQLLNRLDSN